MDARRWTDVVAAFDELVELEPSAQKQRLAALGASDPDLQRRVEELLAGDAHADDRLAGIDHAFTTAFVPTSAREGDADPLKLVGRIVSHFRIIEPLAYGGMGVVYRAEDTQLKRVIALKFPLPAHRFDRSAKERFLHEARVAGALDHPNLCPVHEVGETEDGHLFYAMPLYQGETLKQRLAREGALPVADAINVAKQIATGLGAAHMAGIIHRDLKPANVMLLRDGTVRILDFGLAKESDLGFTDPWRTLGTVSYMAPEQFQGREVDSRADLWALGVVFYEMLTGMRPFRGNHAIGIAHTIVHAEPEPPSLLRGEVTGRVDDVVQTLLRKDPAQRYSSAEEVATALSANVSESLAHDRDGGGAMDTSTLATFSSRPGRSVSRQRMAWSAIGVFTLLVGGAMTFRALGIWPGGSLLSRGSLNPSDSLVVADFDIRGADSSLGRTIASVVGTALSQSTVVTIVPDGIIRSALQRMQRPTAALFVSPVARELAQREGFKAVVEGELAQLATGFVVTVRLVSADGEQLVSVHETAAHLDALLPTIERLTGRIRGRIGESLKRVRASPALDQVTTGSLEALRKYAEVRLLTFDDHARGLLLLKEAVALDSSFAMAWILMSAVYRNGDYPPELAIDALERAYRFRDRLPYRERYHAIGGYFRVGKGRDRARAAEAYEAGLKMDSGGFANNLGLLYMSRREYARAESLFRWYFNRQSGLQVAYENLSNTLYFQGKREEAELVEAETARRFSGAERWGRTAWYLYNRGQLDSAQRAIERQREEGDATLRRVAWLQLSALHLVRGRIAEAERARAEATVANLARGVSRDSVGEELWLASIDSWHRNQPRRALLRLERALARTPLTSLPLVSPQAGEPYYTWVARIYAHARQPDRARAMLVKFTADVRDTALKRVNEWAIHAARGEIALAEGRPLVALVEFRLADQLSDGPIHLSALGFHADVGRAYDEAGMADSAIASFERYLDTPQLIRSAHDATYLAHVLQRLGALYDAKGDRAKAIDYYDRVTELWRNADPELQPKVAQVRRRTELLRSSEQH